jgi:CRP-like cAMP-binding protein
MLTNINRLLSLREVQIFKNLDSYTFLEQLADAMEEVEFPANTTIFHRGESSQLCYILVSGKVRVHIESLAMGELGAGDCFGEMSLFDSKPRPASVTTLEDCVCLTLTQAQVFEAIHENPGIAVNIVRLLTDQIRKLILCQHVLKLNQPSHPLREIVRLL